jgi:hypothetical protein
VTPSGHHAPRLAWRDGVGHDHGFTLTYHRYHHKHHKEDRI